MFCKLAKRTISDAVELWRFAAYGQKFHFFDQSLHLMSVCLTALLHLAASKNRCKAQRAAIEKIHPIGSAAIFPEKTINAKKSILQLKAKTVIKTQFRPSTYTNRT